MRQRNAPAAARPRAPANNARGARQPAPKPGSARRVRGHGEAAYQELRDEELGEQIRRFPSTSSLEQDKLCIICLNERRAVRFVPCGHANACEACVLQLVAIAEPRHVLCPQCKAVITHVEISVGSQPIARQKTFKSPEDLFPEHTIDEYIKAQASSTDAERAALARRAMEARAARGHPAGSRQQQPDNRYANPFLVHSTPSNRTEQTVSTGRSCHCSCASVGFGGFCACLTLASLYAVRFSSCSKGWSFPLSLRSCSSTASVTLVWIISDLLIISYVACHYILFGYFGLLEERFEERWRDTQLWFIFVATGPLTWGTLLNISYILLEPTGMWDSALFLVGSRVRSPPRGCCFGADAQVRPAAQDVVTIATVGFGVVTLLIFFSGNFYSPGFRILSLICVVFMGLALFSPF